MTKKERRDVIAEIRDKLVAQLQDVVDGKIERPAWTMSWDPTLGRQRNGISDHCYRGINVWSCLLAGYSDPRWYTSNQALTAAGYRQEGTGKVRKAKRTGKEYEVKRWVWKGNGDEPTWPIPKGTRGVPIVKYPTRKVVEEDENGDEQIRFFRSRYPHYHTVFNHEQIVWPEGHEPEIDESNLLAFDPRLAVDNAKELWAKHNPKEVPGDGRAFYSPRTDEIGLPDSRSFVSAEAFWAVALHELTHWTGHVSRCDREGITRFSGHGSARYAFEELIAEMGSSTLCKLLGIQTEGLAHETSAYVLTWIETLNNDPSKIVTAASKAQAAVDFILGEEPNYDSDEED